MPKTKSYQGKIRLANEAIDNLYSNSYVHYHIQNYQQIRDNYAQLEATVAGGEIRRGFAAVFDRAIMQQQIIETKIYEDLNKLFNKKFVVGQPFASEQLRLDLDIERAISQISFAEIRNKVAENYGKNLYSKLDRSIKTDNDSIFSNELGRLLAHSYLEAIIENLKSYYKQFITKEHLMRSIGIRKLAKMINDNFGLNTASMENIKSGWSYQNFFNAQLSTRNENIKEGIKTMATSIAKDAVKEAASRKREWKVKSINSNIPDNNKKVTYEYSLKLDSNSIPMNVLETAPLTESRLQKYGIGLVKEISLNQAKEIFSQYYSNDYLERFYYILNNELAQNRILSNASGGYSSGVVDLLKKASISLLKIDDKNVKGDINFFEINGRYVPLSYLLKGIQNTIIQDNGALDIQITINTSTKLPFDKGNTSRGMLTYNPQYAPVAANMERASQIESNTKLSVMMKVINYEKFLNN